MNKPLSIEESDDDLNKAFEVSRTKGLTVNATQSKRLAEIAESADITVKGALDLVIDLYDRLWRESIKQSLPFEEMTRKFIDAGLTAFKKPIVRYGPNEDRTVYAVETPGGMGILGHSVDGPVIFEDSEKANEAIKSFKPYDGFTICPVRMSPTGPNHLANRSIRPVDSTPLPDGAMYLRQFREQNRLTRTA